MKEFMYPKTPRENKIFRFEIIEKAEKDLGFRKAILERCEFDPLFFFNVFLWTYDPRKENEGQTGHLPFSTYEYQDEHILGTIECIDKEIDQWTEKSRDMGFSWMLIGVQSWGWRFKMWSSLYGSYKEDYVDEAGNMDSHFERLRYVFERLPWWMKPQDMVSKFMTISSKELGASIAGDVGENFGTGGRRKFTILDEFALWQFAEKAFRKTRDVTNCRLFGGTPEGKFNLYGKVMTNHKDYSHLKIQKKRLHWTLHPEKSKGVHREGSNEILTSREAFTLWNDGIKVTSPWYEKEKAQRTPLDLAKELDISYAASVTGRVYPAFEEKIRLGDFVYEAGNHFITSATWDYGLDMTAFIVIQKNMITGRNKMIKCFQKKNEEIAFFAAFFTGTPIQGYKYSEDERELIDLMYGWQIHHHFGDPYNGNNRNVVKKSSVVMELAKHGVHIKCRPPEGKNQVQDRIEKATLRLHTLDVHKTEYVFQEAIMQARYPKKKDNSEATGEKNKPVHDETSHIRTCLEYYFDNEPFPAQKKRKTPQELEADFNRLGV